MRADCRAPAPPVPDPPKPRQYEEVDAGEVSREKGAEATERERGVAKGVLG